MNSSFLGSLCFRGLSPKNRSYGAASCRNIWPASHVSLVFRLPVSPSCTNDSPQAVERVAFCGWHMGRSQTSGLRTQNPGFSNRALPGIPFDWGFWSQKFLLIRFPHVSRAYGQDHRSMHVERMPTNDQTGRSAHLARPPSAVNGVFTEVHPKGQRSEKDVPRCGGWGRNQLGP